MERWRPTVGHPGYEVSDLGRVRSVDRVKVYTRRDHHSGRPITVERQHRGRLLAPAPTSTGHLSVCLGRGNSVLVHHLVLEAFVGPRPPPPFEGLHGDDVPANNQLSNLRWGSRSANIHDAIRNGGRRLGEHQWNAKLKDADIPVIRERLRLGHRPSAIARDYRVDESAIRQVRSGRAWRHIKGAAA